MIPYRNEKPDLDRDLPLSIEQKQELVAMVQSGECEEMKILIHDIIENHRLNLATAPDRKRLANLLNNCTTITGNNLFITAVLAQNIIMAKLLLHYGADVNSQNRITQYSALALALRKGREYRDTVEFLLEHKAEVIPAWVSTQLFEAFAAVLEEQAEATVSTPVKVRAQLFPSKLTNSTPNPPPSQHQAKPEPTASSVKSHCSLKSSQALPPNKANTEALKAIIPQQPKTQANNTSSSLSVRNRRRQT